MPYALRSVVLWADETIVCDMASGDRTVAVARSLGAHIVTHERVPLVHAARAFAYAQATRERIFVLDADEVVPPGLARHLRALAASGTLDVGRSRRG